MGDKGEIKGSTAAQVAGVLVALYGALVFVVSIAGDSFNWAVVVLLTLSTLAVLVGIGLMNLNYHAWFVALALNVVSLLGGGLQLFLSMGGDGGKASTSAAKLFWPLITFWLLYSARNACQRKKNNKPGLWLFKAHAPELSASVITLATVLYLKATGSLGFLIFGFPVIVVEFAVLYMAGMNLQKRLGWEVVAHDCD